MGKSGAGVKAVRWVVPALVALAVAAVAYWATASSGLTLEAPVPFVAAAASGCLVLMAALLVSLRRSRSAAGVELRLDRLASPSVAPESRTNPENPGIEAPDVAAIDKAAPAAVEESRDDPNPGIEAIAGVPPEATAAPPAEPAPVRRSALETAGFDAVALAAVLNHYDNVGVPDGDDGLWDELVEAHGAVSIDLRGIASGRCSITLRSGNLVFYVPAYERWVWLIIEGRDTGTSTRTADPGAELKPAVSSRHSDESMSAREQVHLSPSHLEASHAQFRPDRIAGRRGWQQHNPQPRVANSMSMVDGMAPVLSSQKTPAAYEEALFVTEGLLFGAAYGNRVVPYEELVWVIEAATGHVLDLQSMGRFLGDLVDRSYPRHMEVLAALTVPATALMRPPVDTQRPEPPAAEADVVDLTESAAQAQQVGAS